MSIDDTENTYHREESNEEIHSRRSKEDKIFGNGYKTGDGLSEDDEYQYTSSIEVEASYANRYLKDIYEYESGIESNFTLDTIFDIVKKDKRITTILEEAASDSKSAKIKLKREQVNFIFFRIEELLLEETDSSIFNSSIYILEVISALSSNEYKKLFDMLDTEIQEKLLIELNEKYKFLDGKMNKKRIH